MSLELLPVALAAFVVALLAVPLVARLAVRAGAVVHPRGDRLATRTVPTLGGLAIGAGIAIGLVVGYLGGHISLTDGLAAAIGLALMVGLGLRDDLADVRPGTRLLIQVIVGLVVGWILGADLEDPMRIVLAVLGGLGVPVVVNATNLVDNADGLAATLSAISGTAIALGAFVLGLPADAPVVGLAVAAACLAFLVHNRPPARIFMGDAGSLGVGFSIAIAGLLLVRDGLKGPDDTGSAALLVAGGAVAVQLGDTAMVAVTRIRRGASPIVGGVDHTSHRLLALGVGPGSMLLVLALLSVAAMGVALLAATVVGGPAALLGGGFVIAVGVLGFEAWVVRKTPGIAGPAARSER